MKQKKIKVLKVAPGEHPQVVMLENDLDALQKAVSIGCDYQGLIEVVGLEKGVCIICNEEGKLLGSVDESAIKVSMDGRITWAAVPDATHYTIKLTINGEVYDVITVYNPAYDLSDLIAFKNVNSLSIEIQVHGNSKCVSSAITRKEWTITH